MDDTFAIPMHSTGAADLSDQPPGSWRDNAGRNFDRADSEVACRRSSARCGPGNERIVQFLSVASKLVARDDCLLVFTDQGSTQPMKLVACSNGCSAERGNCHACTQAHQAAAREAIGTGRPVMHACATLTDEPCGPSHRKSTPAFNIVASPIRVGDHKVGAINWVRASRRAGHRPADLDALAGIAQLLGQAFYLNRLEQILNSQFAQLAIARQTDGGRRDDAMLQAGTDPERLAKLLAKSFYREMTTLGLDSGQIIVAASEIISQLSGTVKRHRDRRSRATTQARVTAPGTDC